MCKEQNGAVKGIWAARTAYHGWITAGGNIKGGDTWSWRLFRGSSRRSFLGEWE